ncbi:MAG TPA: hypothetical protein PKC72_07160 [Chitinophagaceae bacterium]|nr:hypothetical protein [Chitinophagaceae bacterium]
MTTINIEHLKNYNRKLIAEYLFQYGDNAFDIIIPRDQFDKDDINFSIFWQYYTAAYAGQRLFNISTSFACYVPCPHKQQSFRFEIEVADINKLARALAYIITGYYVNNDSMIRFNQQAGIYFSDAYEGKTISETWSLLHIANKYLGK